MKPYVLPGLILCSSALGLGLYEVIGWSIRRPRRQDAALALLFFTCAVYAAGCAGQYDAASAEATIPWLRLQSAMLCISGIGLVQFFSAVTGLIPRPTRIGLALVFGAFALSQAFDLGTLTWNGSTGDLLRLSLPFGRSWSIYEATPGPLTNFQTLLTLAFFPFLLALALRFKRVDPVKGKRLLAIPLVITLAWINDLLVMYDLLSTPYAMEYAFVMAAVYAGLDRAEREVDAEARIRATLAEKETLIRELYHRTKNNMQVVSSLLKLRSGELDSEPAKAVFKDVEDKIVAMSLVHQKLYESRDLSNIRIEAYIRELCSLLASSHGVSADRLELDLDVEDATMAIDTAVPLGVVVSEIFANSLKHAFPGGRRGRIRIALRTRGEYVDLEISDDGVGLPAGFQVAANGKMGMKTLFAMVEHQLQGSIRLSSEGGVAYQMHFKKKLYSERGRLDG